MNGTSWQTGEILLAALGAAMAGAFAIAAFMARLWMISVDHRLDAIHAIADKYGPERESRLATLEAQLEALYHEVNRIREDLQEVVSGTREWRAQNGREHKK